MLVTTEEGPVDHRCSSRDVVTRPGYQLAR